jgi:phenylalanine ammonia-lyase
LGLWLIHISSLALISARATINSLEVLSLLTSSYLYTLCQAFDLRALQKDFTQGLDKIISSEIDRNFGSTLAVSELKSITSTVSNTMRNEFMSTSKMDAVPRMRKVAASSTTVLFDFFTDRESADLSSAGTLFTRIPAFRDSVATQATTLLDNLRQDYLSGAKGPAPASSYLNKTRPVYEFIRLTLGIRMHGSENYHRFVNGLGAEDITIGQNISLIHEAIRDGKLQAIVAALFN